MSAAWAISEDGASLDLVVMGEIFARITRWSDTKTGEHAWWAVERHDGYGLGLSEQLASACRRAAAAANVDLAAPQDLLDEWGHEDPEAESVGLAATEAAVLAAPRNALHGRCTCGHVWPVIYLPMPLADAAKAMSRAARWNARAGNHKIAAEVRALGYALANVLGIRVRRRLASNDNRRRKHRRAA